MHIPVLLTSILMLATQVCFSQHYGSFKDPRDGHVYKTVKIGNQVWMAKNLDVSTFRNGDPIPHAKTDEEWEQAGYKGQPAWCYYDNNPSIGKTYGKLYNIWAISDPRGLAPAGWKIPSDTDWTILSNFLGGDVNYSGHKLKNTTGWNLDGSGDGNNTSGFSALPGGIRYGHGLFYYRDYHGYWWSQMDRRAHSWYRFLYYTDGLFRRFDFHWDAGMSVRCIKN